MGRIIKTISMIIVPIFILVALFFVTNKPINQNIDQQKAIGESIVFNSQVLKTDREIKIYLPKDYEKASTKYPVLYVLDSQRYFLNGVAFQDNLAWNELVPKFIIVGIITDSQKRRNLLYNDSAKFMRFLEKELIPKIDKDYRTLDQRIYFGWQMAAGLGIEIMADRPSLFQGFLLASPTHMSSDRLDNLSKMLETNPKQNVTIYASLGSVENWAIESMNALNSIFQQNPQKNIKWKYNFSETDNHHTTPLTTINEGLKLFFNDYGPIRFNTLKEFDDLGGIKALKEYYITRGDKYQISPDIHNGTKHFVLLQSYKESNFGFFEEAIKELGGMKFIEDYYTRAFWFNRFATFYLSNDEPTEALEIFEIGLLKFPEASILYSGMGDYYKAMEDINNARKWYTKAIDIAENNDETTLLEYQKKLKSMNTNTIK